MQSYRQLKRIILVAISSTLLHGCATKLGTVFSDAEVRVMGGSLQALVGSGSPPGEYILETTSGTAISRGVFTPPRRSTWMPGQFPINFSVDIRRFSENTAKSCMQIRRPDGRLVAVGFPKQTEFTVPAFEAQWLQHVEIPRIRNVLSTLDRQKFTAQNAARWLSDHPNVYVRGTCRVPDLGAPPAAACRSEREAEAKYAEGCMMSNFGCSLAGAAADVTVAGVLNEGSVSTVANYLAANGCSLRYDRLQGQRSDPWVYFRANGVAWLTDVIYRRLVNESPKGEEKFIVAAIAGALNYKLCMNDAVTNCLNNYQRWEAPGRKLYEQCVNVNTQREASNRVLDRYGGDRDSLEQQIRENERRVQALTKGGLLQRRGAALRTIDGC